MKAFHAFLSLLIVAGFVASVFGVYWGMPRAPMYLAINSVGIVSQIMWGVRLYRKTP